MEHENGVIKRTNARGEGSCSSDTINTTTTITTSGSNSIAASSNTITTTKRHQEERFCEDVVRSFSRTCVLGCQVNKLALCRFPVHDPKRCNNWLKFFGISKERVEKLGGLNCMRVCLKHFNQRQQMAKTRIKTTPTRLQKDALAQAATTTSATTIITLENTKYNNSNSNNSKAQDMKRQSVNGFQLTRSQSNANTNTNNNENGSTIIVQAPKRKTSVSSATSTLSRTSDTPSDTDGVTIKPVPIALPIPTPTPTLTATPAIATIQLKSCVSSSSSVNAVSNVATQNVPIPNTNGFINKLNANGKRKIYLITEKSENNLSSSSSDALNANVNCPISTSKRKMFLIMEDQNGSSGGGNTGGSCHVRSNGNESAAKANSSQDQTENKRKKLTLFADSDTELTTHKFEQILPEILNRIKTQQNVAAQSNGTNNNKNNNNNNGWGITNEIGAEIKLVQPQPKPHEEAKIPITLPPKKNRTKIKQNIFDEVMTSNVPVIVSNANRTIVNVTSTEPTSVLSNNNRSVASTCAGTGGLLGDVGDSTTISNNWEQIYNDKQINLSSDFLFLMKMLPKLESIPEPQKQQVKSCIEAFINQNVSRNY